MSFPHAHTFADELAVIAIAHSECTRCLVVKELCDRYNITYHRYNSNESEGFNLSNELGRMDLPAAIVHDGNSIQIFYIDDDESLEMLEQLLEETISNE